MWLIISIYIYIYIYIYISDKLSYFCKVEFSVGNKLDLTQIILGVV
ncbi:MAG: hypothetical protein MCS20_02115 [Candidatus Phytoplasma mali]|nr:hypothetical protein [Candidatus Phytoplasma australiense]MBZ7920162.1 hypothetical protein [Candidatus Karelsulcia muelleri]MCG7202184.1 hypothetical protein [Candidatus Phytoplasma mali]MCZ8632892.1 hypothetical protein [Spiroplasma sp. Tabriz.8]